MTTINFFQLKPHFFLKSVGGFEKCVYFCSEIERKMKSLFNAYYYFYFYFGNK